MEAEQRRKDENCANLMCQ